MANTTTKDGTATQLAVATQQQQQPAPMVLGSDAFRAGLEPATLNDAYALAQMVAATRICGVETPEDALMRILTGRSLGLSTMQALRGVYVVKGRPSLDASLMQALCMKSAVCEYFECVSTDETQATYRTKRRGRPERTYTFTIQDADRQGLVDRGKDDDAKLANNYGKIPREMLRARCKSTLARLEYPDLMFGMYSREELESGADDGGADDVERRIRDQERSVEVEVVQIQAAARDYAGEAAALIERIQGAKSRQARAEVRAAIEAWDGIEPHLSRVREAYNASKPQPTAQPGSAPEMTAAAPVTTAANPAPVPTGNLFTGERKP